jgi:putative transcriptional regulator
MLRIAVPDLVSNSYFPIIAAVELGLFKSEGFDASVDLLFPVPKTFEALRDGQLDFVVGSAHATLLAFPEWKGARLLCAIAKHTYWFLVIRSDLNPRRGDLSVSLIETNAAEQSDYLTGQLLVATPEMRDPRFVETVIYVVKHDAEGAFGLVINRPLAKGPIEDLLKGFGIDSSNAKGEIIVHYGGPVSPRAGFVLHSDDVILEDSAKVANGIAMTSDPKLIEAIAQGKGPRQSLFIMGYAGWAPGQLEGELLAGSWFVVSGDKALIFGQDADRKWRQAMDKRKIPL